MRGRAKEETRAVDKSRGGTCISAREREYEIAREEERSMRMAMRRLMESGVNNKRDPSLILDLTKFLARSDIRPVNVYLRILDSLNLVFSSRGNTLRFHIVASSWNI